MGMTASALAQGNVIFENAAGNGHVYMEEPFVQPGIYSYAQPGTYTVALLWANSSSLVPQASLTQIATYSPTAAAGDGPGYFFDGSGITTPSGSGVMVFEVQAWTGNFANYSAAVGGGGITGQTQEFLNNTTIPPNSPVNLSGFGGGWDGNLYIGAVPEPSIMAIAGFGTGAFWYFRRRKTG
jgi:hypothetical protein